MLGFKFYRSTRTPTISSGFLLSSAAVTGRAIPEICRSVIAKQHLSCLPLQRFPLLWNHRRDLSPRHFPRNNMGHWLSPSHSPLLPSQHTHPRLLPSPSNSTSTKSSMRICSMPKPISWRSHATAHEPNTMYLQPLDPSCRRQSIRRGLIISLPILIIYLLLYLLRYVLIGTEIGRHHLNTVARFWHYTRRERRFSECGQPVYFGHGAIYPWQS